MGYREELEAAVSATSATLRTFPKGAMGLTLDSAKASPEWKAARREADQAFEALRRHNRESRAK